MDNLFRLLIVPSLLLLGCAAFGQETPIYQFGATGSADGATPNGGLIFDQAGNMYGTTEVGGVEGAGIAFELSPAQGGTWKETILYNFCSVGSGCLDGGIPLGGFALDVIGNLYGTTKFGGANGEGTVFELSPPFQKGGSWMEQVLWSFGDAGDGLEANGGLAMDGVGNLYGTTQAGTVGAGAGVVFELTPGQNGWTESILHAFCLNYPDCSDGAQPLAGVTFDKAGNLYGTTYAGGQSHGVGWGVTYELSPTQNGWKETVLDVFSSAKGGRSTAGVTFDPEGHLYGSVELGGKAQCGGIFRVSPPGSFSLSGGNGCQPQASVLYSDAALYGTSTLGGAYSEGAIFKLTQKGDTVNSTVLHSFCEQADCADGSEPNGSLTLKSGQLYGATAIGGANNTGLIYRIPE
jgi:uncharacterized repeat protein (TIGR03803 family)